MVVGGLTLGGFGLDLAVRDERYSSNGKEFRIMTKASIEECLNGVLGLSVIGLKTFLHAFVMNTWHFSKVSLRQGGQGDL